MAKTVYLGQTLPLQRGNRGYFQSTTNALENEKSKFINLILTKKGERVSNPTFGCDLWRLLFEQKNEDTQELAKQYVLDAVNAFMPYLVLQEIQITNTQTFLNDNSINLYVKYGFINNPLATDSVLLSIGAGGQSRISLSGRTATSNVYDAETDPRVLSSLGRRTTSNGSTI
jgi:phage baseplate assembly protein W